MANRKIFERTALTAAVVGDYLPIVDISEPDTASKNKSTSIEKLFRGVSLGTAAAGLTIEELRTLLGLD